MKYFKNLVESGFLFILKNCIQVKPLGSVSKAEIEIYNSINTISSTLLYTYSMEIKDENLMCYTNKFSRSKEFKKLVDS